MNPIPNPDSWMDVLTILAVAAMAAVPSWAALRNHRNIKQVKDQVVYGHEGKPALRADIDALTEQVARIVDAQDRAATHIDGMRDEMRGGLAAIRGDLSEERQARRAGDAAIRDEIARHHPE